MTIRSFACVCALVLAVAAGGCEKKTAANAALAKLADLRVAMCACKDRACAEKVQAEMSAWGRDQLKPNTPVKVSEDDSKKMAALSDEYGTCLLNAVGAPSRPAETPAGSAAGSAEPTK